jgi:hypothetical protein
VNETVSGSFPGPGVEPSGYDIKTVIRLVKFVDLYIELRPEVLHRVLLSARHSMTGSSLKSL